MRIPLDGWEQRIGVERWNEDWDFDSIVGLPKKMTGHIAICRMALSLCSIWTIKRADMSRQTRWVEYIWIGIRKA